MGGYCSLPTLGGSTLSPERGSSQLVQSSHQEPSCCVAFCRHSSAVFALPASPPSLTQCLPLPLDGGLIMPAMWPLLARAKRVLALVSCPTFPAEYHGTMLSLSAPTAQISPPILLRSMGRPFISTLP